MEKIGKKIVLSYLKINFVTVIIKTAKKIIEKIQEVMYPIKGKTEGVIMSMLNKKESTFGFTIVSDSKKKCINIYNKMLNIINN